MGRTIEEQRKMIEEIYEKVTNKQPRGKHEEMLNEINRSLRDEHNVIVHVGGFGNAVEIVPFDVRTVKALTEDDINDFWRIIK